VLGPGNGDMPNINPVTLTDTVIQNEFNKAIHLANNLKGPRLWL